MDIHMTLDMKLQQGHNIIIILIRGMLEFHVVSTSSIP